MPTSRWASSLANIEARFRRSLGIAGPLNLALEERPVLTPVLIADDLTRPGCVGSDYRGRRWSVSTSPGTIAGGAVGLVELLCAGLNSTVGNVDRGGVIVEWMDISIGGAVQNQLVDLALYYASPFTAAQTALIRDGFMVDPIGPTGFPGIMEQSPMQVGTSAAGVNVNARGGRIWEDWLLTNGGPHHVRLDLFLREQAFLGFGNPTALVAGQPATFFVTFRGRVF